MKKIFGLAVLVLPLLFALSSCVEDTEPSKMVFKFEDGTKTFTINENFEFTVDFLVADSNFAITVGDKVSGKIKEASGKWTDSPLTGIVYSMTTTIGVGSLLTNQEVGVSLTYTKSGTTIDAVVLAFTGGALEGAANGMMAGTYTRQ